MSTYAYADEKARSPSDASSLPPLSAGTAPATATAPTAPTAPTVTSTSTSSVICCLPPPPPPSTPRNPILASADNACSKLTPSFFTINMGTGITSILLYNFPYPAEWLRVLGVVVFVLNVVVFALLAIGSVVRYVRYKGLFGATLTHGVAGMFWGALPMGLATIVNMVAYVCVPKWGGHWVYFAVALWWIDAIISVLVNVGMVFAMFTKQSHTHESMSATWLLPIVSSVVAAASGGVVASAIMPYDVSLAHSTLAVSFVIWGTGVPLACFVMALWIYRSTLYGPPPAGAIPSVFLPVGPCGQGSFGIVLLGRTVREMAYQFDTSFTSTASASSSASSIVYGVDSIRHVADAIYAGCVITGLILWGLGLCWYIIGFGIFLRHLRIDKTYIHPNKFTLGLWALTFPIGVFATAANILAVEFDSPAFRGIGAFLSAQVVLNWLYVAGCTAWGVMRGSVFVAPELAVCGGKAHKRFGGDLEGQ